MDAKYTIYDIGYPEVNELLNNIVICKVKQREPWVYET